MAREAWNLSAVAQPMASGGERWQSAHSCGTTGVVVRAPLLQSTASCFISPLAGVRRASIGPTNPTGAEAAWQSRHAVGWVGSEACSRPGKNVPVAALAWQVLHAIDCETPAIVWQRPVDGDTTIAGIDDRHLYMLGHELSAIDLKTRGMRWSTKLPAGSAAAGARIFPGR